MANREQQENCPICYRNFPAEQIENHVNKCIFLNSSEDNLASKKRSISPILGNSSKSPRCNYASQSRSIKGNNALDKSIPETKKSVTTIKLESETNDNLSENNNLLFITPLATQVQPKTLDDFFGQTRVLGKDTVLRQLLEKGDIQNMILWGPPGCGKTSLSAVVHGICRSNPNKLKYVSLCAANCGIKDVSNIVSAAKLQLKFGKKTVLFMDEIHRFNKRQQDIFLLHVENGDIILIGATTENPSFSLNNALLSRCRVIVLEKLEPENVVLILERALTRLKIGLVENKDFVDQKCLSIEKEAINWLADTSDGDARIALSNLQLLLQQNENSNKLITVEDIKDGIKKSHLLYDRKGEEHYNIISAMHKSIRGSDANAALYWTTRMIVSGEDPLFIARRLVRAASEDIGNADPKALQLAIATMQGCQLIGMPEADVLLAQCAIYLARAPKSREADSALAATKRIIMECKGLQPSVPMHIRNAPTKLMRELGYGKLQRGKEPSFMPEGLEKVDFFNN